MLLSKSVKLKIAGVEVEQIQFALTQGDTAVFRAVPKDCDGKEIDLSLVDKCLFKLSLADMKEIFVKEFEKQDDGFYVRLESEETAKIPVNEYIYEVEYTFTDGTVNTPNQTVFEILDQIIK